MIHISTYSKSRTSGKEDKHFNQEAGSGKSLMYEEGPKSEKKFEENKIEDKFLCLKCSNATNLFNLLVSRFRFFKTIFFVLGAYKRLF